MSITNSIHLKILLVNLQSIDNKTNINYKQKKKFNTQTKNNRLQSIEAW